jgi:hypothetical protein
MPSAGNTAARQYDDAVRTDDRVHVEATIGTDGDQVAIVSGILRRSWTENGRRYATTRPTFPIRFGTAVLSAEVRGARGQVERHPASDLLSPNHAYDVDRMAEGMKASLEYYTKTFGPYQFHQLRIARDSAILV